MKTIALLAIIIFLSVGTSGSNQHEIRNKDVKFELVKTDNSKKLKIQFNEQGKLKEIKVIGVTGENLGSYSYDGKDVEKLEIDVSKMPPGPHMFKFIFNDKKEINEIFRISNK